MYKPEYEVDGREWSPEQRLERVEQTWEWIGGRIRPLNLIIWLRTDPEIRIRPSGIIIPESEAAFFAHHRPNKPVWGTVLSAPERTGLQTGDRVLYPRDRFVWMRKHQPDGSFFGFIHEEFLDLIDPIERE